MDDTRTLDAIEALCGPLTDATVGPLYLAGTISDDEHRLYWETSLAAKVKEATAAATAAAAGKVHFGVTGGGAVNLRGVPGSPGSFGLTL